jgi:hypothetical protein
MHPRSQAPGPAMEGRAHTFLVQPLPENPRALRKENGELFGLVALRFGLDLLADVLKTAQLLFRDKL